MTPTIRKLALPGALVVGLGATLTLADAAHDPLPSLQAQDAAPSAPAPAGSPASLSAAFRSASRVALPAVVHIQVEGGARPVSDDVPPEARGTPWEEMFRNRGRSAPSQASGSGFIMSPDGYVVTNNHVVEGASAVKVVLNDGREFTGRVVGRDPNTDIAVLKVDARNLPTVKLGGSDALETGDWVLALGYPLSLGQSTTAGIVSAKGRSLGIMRNTSATAPLEHFIQTDAAINPGNSGGPLVDLQGRVVGVNSAIASPTGYYSGYGFAVPIDLAKRVVDDLIRFGEVHRPMLGVEIRDAAAADAEVFGLASPAGAVISSEPRAGAREAGLRLGDVIVAVDGNAVRNTGDLMERVMRKQPGERVALDVVRYGQPRRVAVKLASFDNARAAAQAPAAPRDGDGSVVDRLGFQAMPVTPQIAQQLRLSSAAGMVVTGVDPSGPAARQLAPGLLIERFNGREIRDAADLSAAMSAVRPGAVVSIVGRRPDGSATIINYRARA
jgi:serine protease Do